MDKFVSWITTLLTHIYLICILFCDYACGKRTSEFEILINSNKMSPIRRFHEINEVKNTRKCEDQVVQQGVSHCERNNLSYSACANYVNKELRNACGGTYNCVVTSGIRGALASYESYGAEGSRKK